MSEITAERLRELVVYDPLEGTFKWKETWSNYRQKGQEFGSYSHNGKPSLDGKQRAPHYKIVRLDGKFYRLHRLAFLYVTGRFPPQEVRFVDGNTLNLRWDNLKCADARDRARNQRLRYDSSTRVQGVHYDKRRKKYVAYIGVNGKKVHLGYHRFLWKAVAVREIALREEGYWQNHGEERHVSRRGVKCK